MAVEIHNSGKRVRFDCVDTWHGSVEHTAPDSKYFVPELAVDAQWLYRQFLLHTRPVCDLIHPIRLGSQEAVGRYENRSLDFVFIDASHEYDDVRADILAWYPKVKRGGFLAGHDYTTFDEVKRAVDELLIERNYPCMLKKSYWLHRKG